LVVVVVDLVGWVMQEQVLPLQQVLAMVVTDLWELVLQLLVQHVGAGMDIDAVADADAAIDADADRRKMVWSFPLKVLEIMLLDLWWLKCMEDVEL
jgi:hypothetical protein